MGRLLLVGRRACTAVRRAVGFSRNRTRFASGEFRAIEFSARSHAAGTAAPQLVELQGVMHSSLITSSTPLEPRDLGNTEVHQRQIA